MDGSVLTLLKLLPPSLPEPPLWRLTYDWEASRPRSKGHWCDGLPICYILTLGLTFRTCSIKVCISRPLALIADKSDRAEDEPGLRHVLQPVGPPPRHGIHPRGHAHLLQLQGEYNFISCESARVTSCPPRRSTRT